MRAAEQVQEKSARVLHAITQPNYTQNEISKHSRRRRTHSVYISIDGNTMVIFTWTSFSNLRPQVLRGLRRNLEFSTCSGRSYRNLIEVIGLQKTENLAFPKFVCWLRCMGNSV